MNSSALAIYEVPPKYLENKRDRSGLIRNINSIDPDLYFDKRSKSEHRGGIAKVPKRFLALEGEDEIQERTKYNIFNDSKAIQKYQRAQAKEESERQKT